MKRITSLSANGVFATNDSISRMICTEITPTRCFQTSFQIVGAWYDAT